MVFDPKIQVLIYGEGLWRFQGSLIHLSVCHICYMANLVSVKDAIQLILAPSFDGLKTRVLTQKFIS